MHNLLNKIKSLGKGGSNTIAIGAGSQRKGYIEKVLNAAGSVDFAEIVVVGQDVKSRSSVAVKNSSAPAKKLIQMFRNGEVDAAVRGSLGASEVLKEIKNQFNVDKVGRIALLETLEGVDFFFAPVGIDEGNTLKEKAFLIEKGIEIMDKFGVSPKIGVLSGGRKSDVGRHKNVDRTIREAEDLVKYIKNRYKVSIKNFNILVEDAVAEGANIIIAPDGITGNLMFRTLTFLGGGRGYGAFITGIDRSFVDTSRAGTSDDYIVSIMMANAMVEQ